MSPFACSSPVLVEHPASSKLLALCYGLPDEFGLQDVVDAVQVHLPEALHELPEVWAYVRDVGRIVPLGLDACSYRVAPE